MVFVSFTCLYWQGGCVYRMKMRFGVTTQIVLGAGDPVGGPCWSLRPGKPHFRC